MPGKRTDRVLKTHLVEITSGAVRRELRLQLLAVVLARKQAGKDLPAS